MVSAQYLEIKRIEFKFTNFDALIMRVFPFIFGLFVTNLWPLIDIIISFMLNIEKKLP